MIDIAIMTAAELLRWIYSLGERPKEKATVEAKPGTGPSLGLSKEGGPSGGGGVSKATQFTTLIGARVHSIAFAVNVTLHANEKAVVAAVMLLSRWMRDGAPVRIIGAGRALLAAGMPANRLAHGGAQVSFMGGMVPLPNSELGGGIIACSASGKTPTVLQAMQIARQLNPKIKIIGLADGKASSFCSLCDTFIGLQFPSDKVPNPLSALADTEEYMISEILDGLVVLAGSQNGFDDEAWRRGHEDIGPTGPYAARKKGAHGRKK